VTTVQQPANHYLAQLNIGRIRYEIEDPRMADFSDNLAMVNGLAERSPGFVWRYIDESGNSTSTRPYSDPRIAINLSVWESVEALERFVYQWVPVGHRPDVAEAVARLEHLKRNGASDHAFDWQATTVQLWKTARCAPNESAA
jgi:uncharacterized protein DUF3291